MPMLTVSDGHRLWYEEHGTGDRPVVVLHGGPGGGLQRSVLRFFNLRRWRVILYDQRGCGRSTPRLSVSANTTADLVADLERLRAAVCIGVAGPWTVFGGSWGSTLALAYTAAHPTAVAALVLRGVCLMEPWEQSWLYEEGGASRLYPEAWDAFVAGSGSFSSGSSKNRRLTAAYHRRLSARRTRKAAALSWWRWEETLSTLLPARKTKRTSTRAAEEIAVLENHYFRHNAWIKPGELIAAARRIPASIPVLIVQGRYDLVCPAASAIALAAAVPHAQLTITHAGHAASEPATAKALREVTDKLLSSE